MGTFRVQLTNEAWLCFDHCIDDQIRCETHKKNGGIEKKPVLAEKQPQNRQPAVCPLEGKALVEIFFNYQRTKTQLPLALILKSKKLERVKIKSTWISINLDPKPKTP